MKFLSVDFDEVIKSRYITAVGDYGYAINHLIPLIDRLDIQRNIQDSKFYTRLEKDLVKGCIMPPLTLAFIDQDAIKIQDIEEIGRYVDKHISKGFILDGIQRLNTLQRTFKKYESELNINRPLFLNIVICSSMDNLLYRMITLNNGQKPMSARHQIEILTTNLVDFDATDRPIYTEKDAKKFKIKVAFNKVDFVKSYLAFLANSTNIENQKIIEEKLDELIADKILDSYSNESGLEFSQVLEEINRLTQADKNFKWFKNANNLIGFCVGIKKGFKFIAETTINEFEQSTKKFDQAFESFNYSKIKVGRIRRNLVSHFIEHYQDLKQKDVLELVDNLSQVD